MGGDDLPAVADTVRPMIDRQADRLLDLAVLGLASWTLVYQLCFVAKLGVVPAVVLEAIVVVAAVLLRRLPHPGTVRAATARADGTPPELRVVLVALPMVAAVVFAMYGAVWWLSWALWCGAALLALAMAWRLWPAVPGRLEGPPARPSGRSAGWVVLLCVATAAVLALLIVVPDADDTNYVHLSNWIAANGDFPHRDTLHGDQIFPALYWPPVDSYPALTGAIGYVTGIASQDLVYLVVPPTFSALAVLALWRLLRCWRVVSPTLGLVFALVFLIADGQRDRYAPDAYSGGYSTSSAGAFFLSRMWQGKVLFICLVVPLLYVYVRRHLRESSWRSGILLAGAGVAGVGLSTSAIFVVPLLVFAVLLPVAVREPRRAGATFLVGAAYPLLAGVVTLSVGGRTPDRFYEGQIEPEVQSHFVLGVGVYGVLGMLGALVCWWAIKEPVGRIMAAGATVVAAVIFAPGIGHLTYDLSGLSRTQWRLIWILPIGALVGAMLATAFLAIRRLRWQVVAAALGAVTLVMTAIPLWSQENHATLDFATWKFSQRDRQLVDMIVEHSRPGDVVLLPEQPAWALSSLQLRARPVITRGFYSDALSSEPGFHGDARQRLLGFVESTRVPTSLDQLDADLRRLSVDLVCVRRPQQVPAPNTAMLALRMFREVGYEPVAQTTSIRCLTYRD